MRLDQGCPRYVGGGAEGLPRILSSLPRRAVPSAAPSERSDDASNRRLDVASDTDALATSPPSTSIHLVIHFDINETILIGDEAGGDTVDDVVNKMLAKSAFVRIPPTADSAAGDFDTHNVVPRQWWDGSPIREESDANDSLNLLSGGSLSPAPLYTGWEWPEHCCPYYRTAYKKHSKSFVRHHGAPYLPLYRRIYETLLAAHSSDHLLPAFFRTLVELTARKVPHTVVLRTFGSDLGRVAAAVSDFAEGRHPDHPYFVNPDYVLHPSNLYKGRWIRKQRSTKSDATTNGEVGTNDDEMNDEFVYQLSEHTEKDGPIVAEGDDQVLDRLHSCTICGIQDDYAFWSAHGCQPWAGKPVWTVPTKAQSQTYYYHHVLFDDNIHNLELDSSASVRVPCSSSDVDGLSSSPSYRTLTGNEILREQGIHLIRVPTIEPVLKENWFVEQIDRVWRNAGPNRHQPS